MSESGPYVAPAAEVLTVLHRPGGDGSTACGRAMRPEGLWMPVDGRDGDQICTGCLLPGSAVAAEDELTGSLW